MEELEAADSHKARLEPPKVLSRASEYASIVSNFDMLAQETQEKMDQLKALTDKLADLEVTDPSLTKLGKVSEDMKQALAYDSLG